MSPRIAFTTACSDSPSKLNVAAPELPPRFGGGALAALRLMTSPLPRRICAAGAPETVALFGKPVVVVPVPSSTGRGRFDWITGAPRSPSFLMSATGWDVQPPAIATKVAAHRNAAKLDRSVVMARSRLIAAPGVSGSVAGVAVLAGVV